jgi:hypothetical protein
MDVIAIISCCRAWIAAVVVAFAGPSLDDLRRSARSWSAQVWFPAA